MPPPGFDRDALDELIGELVHRLSELDEPIEIQIVGGAAIMLMYDPPDRGITTDIDALHASKIELVTRVADEIALDRGLPHAWLNFKVQMFAPDPTYPDPEWHTLRAEGRVRVTVPDPRLLLAMKLHAGRGQRDLPDIDLLLDVCGVRSYQDAVAVFEAFYTRDVLKTRVIAHLEQRFGSG